VNELKLLLAKAKKFEQEAHAILARHESSSSSRVIVLENSYKRLTALSLKQDELFRQALRCIEHELYRAAHVLAWAGFMDLLEEKLGSDGLAKLKAARPAWKNTSSMEEIREYHAEFQLIEVAHIVGLCTKNQTKALQGLLNKRNECAHPSYFFPDLNDTLGYISELLTRIDTLRTKTL
jgi:hypothetical protein